jgi:hypothetical protein
MLYKTGYEPSEIRSLAPRCFRWRCWLRLAFDRGRRRRRRPPTSTAMPARCCAISFDLRAGTGGEPVMWRYAGILVGKPEGEMARPLTRIEGVSSYASDAANRRQHRLAARRSRLLLPDSTTACPLRRSPTRSRVSK